MLFFFISVVSDLDYWLYILSRGGFFVGCKNLENVLFFYYIDDKIYDSGELSGSKIILLVCLEGKIYFWEFFFECYQGVYNLMCNLYKNICGN